MKSKLTFFTSILLLVFACKTLTPFTSAKEKRTKSNLIKNKFRLTNAEFKKIKNEDSIIFEVAKSIEKNVKPSLTERRLDSFFLKSYTSNELLIILKLDYNFPNLKNPFEYNRAKNADGFEIKNMDQMRKFVNGGLEKKLDSTFGMKKKDSLKKKKNR